MIDLRESDYTILRQRMEDDYLLAMLVDTILADPTTKMQLQSKITKHVANNQYEFPVVLNDAMTFMDRCVAILGADKVVYEITGGDGKQKLDATVQHELEDAYNYWLYVNDQQLVLRGQAPLRNDQNWYNLYRGWMGSIWIMYKIGDKYIPSIIPCDPKGMTWEFSARGLKQFSYPVRMGKVEAGEKFKKLFKELPANQKYVDLKCVWTDKQELVFMAGPGNISIEGSPINNDGKGKEHGLGVCPGVVTFNPGQPGSMIGDESYQLRFSRQGESIMAPNRRIYPMLNKLASILASIAQKGWKADAYLKSDRTEGWEKDPQGAGHNIAQIGKDEDLGLWPFRDLSQALTYLTSLLTSDKQKGGLSDINYGQIQFQVASLVVAQLKDDRDGIFVPRRTQNKIHYGRGFEIFRQMIKGGKFYEVDDTVINPEDAIDIDTKLFEDKFVININYTSISPEENISNWTIAKQADGMIPREEILRDIIHHPDPQGAMEKLALQTAHDTVPGLHAFDMAMAASPGNLSEEKKQEIRTLLIMKYVNDILDQPAGQAMPAIPGVASQPKPEIGPSSPEKVAQKKLNQTGQMNAMNARRSAGG